MKDPFCKDDDLNTEREEDPRSQLSMSHTTRADYADRPRRTRARYTRISRPRVAADPLTSLLQGVVLRAYKYYGSTHARKTEVRDFTLLG